MRLAISSLALLIILLHATIGRAEVITLSGEVSYFGSYSGSELYVAAIDTTGPDDVNLLDLQIYFPGSPPFAQAYSVSFENSGVADEVAIASFLDVDGGGISDISGADVFGWYAGTAEPTFVSSGSSLTGLNFDLPLAEIHGTLTFQAEQYEARVDITTDLTCGLEGLRPQPTFTSGGAYSIVGIYAGSYCVRGQGATPSGSIYACYGDPSCVEPEPVVLGTTTILNGIDLDFDAMVPLERRSWSRLKSEYR